MGLLINICLIIFCVISLVHLESKGVIAIRVLKVEDKDDHQVVANGNYEKKGKLLIGLEALPRGQTPSSQSSSCTYIPGSGGSKCPLNGKNFAVLHHQHDYPRLMLRFGMATSYQQKLGQ